ncbi:MAG: N-acetylmuramoyl-L-alanine amidase [bacterium]|jgi:N-acetylmuramoyl-L-alanine amidase
MSIAGRIWVGLIPFVWLLMVFPMPASAVVFRGLGLNEVMASYGFGAPAEYGKSAVYRSRTATVIFEAGSRRVVVNGLSLYLNRSVLKAAGNWVIAPVDAVDTVGAILLPSRALRKASSALVVLDPGHGGADPGTGQGSLQEKGFTLDIAKRVRARLRENHVDVMMTRDRDTTMTLEERCWRADRYGADVFVSVHFNASRNQAISGVETYIVPASGYPTTVELEQNVPAVKRRDCPGNRFDGANVVLAQYLHKGLMAHTGALDRGIRRARFYVIRNANCPATLVECGFLSNRKESSKILDDDYRDRIAEGVSRGILTYLSRVRQQHLPPVKNM